MRTLHVGLRVADIVRSVEFYESVGYEIVGSVAGTPIGDLTMLKLPGDEFVTIELVHDGAIADRAPIGTGVSHIAVHVESMATIVERLRERGVDVEGPSSPDGSDEFLTATIVDPDGNRLELVQWPPGHGAGMTAADFAEGASSD